MGCCGDKSRAKAVTDIARGFIVPIVEDVLRLPRYTGFDARIKTCEACEHRTWLTGQEWKRWLWDNRVDIAKNPHTIPDTTTALPVVLDYEPGRMLVCQVCRCICACKARLKDQHCCKGLWTTE
jgi:hypothetical protein